MIEKIIYWSPYIPFVGPTVMVYRMLGGSHDLCTDDGAHFVLSFISNFVLTSIIVCQL